MEEKKIKNLFSIFVFFILFYSSSLQSLESSIYIVLKIENEIVRRAVASGSIAQA